ncbi:M28 family peptidase [bacterium]|nr:M28 family peptidase [bacterium]
MARLFSILFILVSCSQLRAQNYDYSIGRQIEKIDSFSFWLEELTSIGVRETGSEELNLAGEYLISKYKQFGYTDIKLDTFYYSDDTLYNIIIEKPGLDPNKWIIVCSHYDSKNSVGANDNGSGVVATLETARIIQSIETRVGVRFIHFSAEEQGLIGSNYYVKNSLDTLEDLQLVLNLDQLGGTLGETEGNKKIYCERDEAGVTSNNALSYLKTDTLANLTRAYSFLEPVISNAYSSDYIPFEDAGYIITGLYQYSDDNGTVHTSNDDLEHLDLDALKQVIQVALAGTMYFSRNTLPLSVGTTVIPKFEIFPNPAQDFVQLKLYSNEKMNYKIRSFDGKTVLDGTVIHQTAISLHDLQVGVYVVGIYTLNGVLINSSKLIIAP